MKPVDLQILKCTGVSVNFGGVIALKDTDLTVKKKSITAIIGPNGAGKTTLLNVISGFVKCESGKIEMDGNEITRNPPHEIGNMGIVRTFQNLEIFSNMSVIENVMMGCHRLVKYSVLDSLLKTPEYWRKEKQCMETAAEKLKFVGFQEKTDAPAADLPFGSQRLLELARALASEPEIMLLDEPAAGLNIKETRMLAGVINRVREELGITIVLVEHDMDLVMRISDRITVLNFGEIIAEGTPPDVQKDKKVIAAYLGEED